MSAKILKEVSELYVSILKILNESHLTKAEISRQTGISAKQIERWMSGETTNIRQSSANQVTDKLTGGIVESGKFDKITETIILNQQRLIDSLDEDISILKVSILRLEKLNKERT